MNDVPADELRAADDGAVTRVMSGHKDDYAALVLRHEGAVRRVLSGLLDPTLIEGLVQQTFVQAYEHLGRYRVGHDFGAWVRGIAANLLRMELRRRGREDRNLHVYHQHLLARMADDGAGERERIRMTTVLSECIEQLAPAAAHAIALRYEQGLAIPDVARALKRSVLATRQLLFRVREALRACAEQKLEQI